LETILDTGERRALEESKCEKDLGVMIANDLKWGTQVQGMVAKANRALGILKRTFTSRDSNLWKTLYTSLVRPHLEYASSVWNSLLQQEIDELERVQRRATKIPENAYKKVYDSRLKEWGLTSLEVRRKRGDLIQIYKSINGIEKINWHTGPTFSQYDRSRAAKTNEKRLVRETFPASQQNSFCHFTNVRHDFFLNRVSVEWNKLSNTQINAICVNSFKAMIDKTGS